MCIYIYNYTVQCTYNLAISAVQDNLTNEYSTIYYLNITDGVTHRRQTYVIVVGRRVTEFLNGDGDDSIVSFSEPYRGRVGVSLLVTKGDINYWGRIGVSILSTKDDISG